MDEIDTEIRNDFLTEAQDLLIGTEKCFLALEKNPSDLENLNLIFRLAHNLKGSSGAVGFMDLADFTHKLESLLLALKEGRLATTCAIVDLLLRTNDYLVKTVETLQENHSAAYANPSLATELVLAMEGRLESSSNDGLAEDAVTDRAAADAAVPAPGVASPASTPTPPQSSSPSSSPPPTAPSSSQKAKDENIRVSVARIEQLLNNVGELSILQAVMVQQGIGFAGQMPQLMRDTLSAMTKIIKETQTISMGLRMVPVKQTFQKMERIVRDTSKALGKTVELHLSGEETELDKTVLEQLADPLVHLVRNAVDHGLENGGERMAAGKPEIGHVHLSAYHSAGQIVIEIKEDGRGLDPDCLVAKAKAKGLVSSDESFTPEQAYQLIFAPGFSTKEEVTDVSGRGVGMDVVKTNIAALQGRIEIETALGRGTGFKIFLPLTLAIIDSVVIRSDSDRFVIPLSQVSEFFKPQQADINLLYDREEILTLRKEPLAAHRLTSLLGKPDSRKAPAWDLTSLIVRDASGNASAILVDRIVAQQQVVIKPLGTEVKNKTGVMGSAILGDGKPALILDLFELMKHLGGHEKKRHKTNPKMEAA